MDSMALERFYREGLEERIIAETVRRNNVSYEKAMDLYYTSRLCGMIERGEYDIQYLDYRLLTQYLIDEIEEIK